MSQLGRPFPPSEKLRFLRWWVRAHINDAEDLGKPIAGAFASARQIIHDAIIIFL